MKKNATSRHVESNWEWFQKSSPCLILLTECWKQIIPPLFHTISLQDGIANRSLSNDPPSINTTGQSLSLFKLNYPDPSNDTTATPMPLPLWHLQICWGSRSWSLHEQHARHCFYLDHSRQFVSRTNSWMLKAPSSNLLAMLALTCLYACSYLPTHQTSKST